YRDVEPFVPESPTPSCDVDGVVPPEVDPEGAPDFAFDLGTVGTDPVQFCGAVGNKFDDGWLFALAGPSVVTLDTPFCDCAPEEPHFAVVAVDPAPQRVGAGALFAAETLNDLPALPLGPGLWMVRIYDPGGVNLDYVGEISAEPAGARSLRIDAPSDLLGAPLVGGQISGWTAFPLDVADVLLVQITEQPATLRVTEFTGEFVTLSLVTDENNDGLNNQVALQQDRIDGPGQVVTYDVEPGFYWIEVFGGPAVYTFDFEEGFGIGAPF
ncbi:MAG: hypothetical protein AAF211_09965, partial [Myxococcota bacterium]